jgi:hypothetical protein
MLGSRFAMSDQREIFPAVSKTGNEWSALNASASEIHADLRRIFEMLMEISVKLDALPANEFDTDGKIVDSFRRE